MANMVDSVCAAVMALAGYGLRVNAAMVSMLRRACCTCFARSTWPASASRLPLVRQQFLDPAVQPIFLSCPSGKC